MFACRVVLVRPETAGNIGAVARAMRNFGLSELVLVAPVADPLAEQARQLATHHATPLLETARVVRSLDEALADCVAMAATSAQTGGLYRRQTVGSPTAVARVLVEAAQAGPVALVFGPERTGLSNEDVSRCHHLIAIPADETYPVLNLAQAATVCLYELYKARTGAVEERAEAASGEMLERMFAALQTALTEVRYLRGSRGEVLMFALRHLLARARPSPMEARLLFGLARQLRWAAARADLEGDGPAEE